MLLQELNNARYLHIYNTGALPEVARVLLQLARSLMGDVLLVARAGVLPCTQFALHASSGVADLLRVLHDYMWFSFFRWRRECMVVDDVRHAYGSCTQTLGGK